MKKISLVVAIVMLNIGLVAYGTSSGNGNPPPDCAKKCTTKVCEKSTCDTTACKPKCEPKDCKPGK